MMVIRIFIALLFISSTVAADHPKPLDGHSVIRAKAGNSEIVITTTSRTAGAIHSLTWNGKEFIDSFDHGRQLQSASNLDCGNMNYFSETFNPTEAGSRSDGAGEKSTSKLLKIKASGNLLETTNQMAFWLKPNEKSDGHPALNKKMLSDHLISKRVSIGYKSFPHAVDYEVVFTLPKGEHLTYAQFEALTGYMPSEFSRFWRFLPDTGKLAELDDGPGEQNKPVILATPNGSHAMGIFSPDQPSSGYAQAGYGRWRFNAEKVVKWNCVFRIRDPKGVAGGEYKYRCFVIVGSLDDVKETLAGLHGEFKVLNQRK